MPSASGVGRLWGAGGRHLVTGRAANLKGWAARHLGLRPARPGRRPPTDLRSVAETLSFVVTSSPFQQRLVFERLMARTVAPEARRDLRPAHYLHLDPRERFPRVTTRTAGSHDLFGPFRNRQAAERARDSLLKLFRLRPCDYAFEPDPGLPLGLGCVYAQVRTCAAPCLARVTEDQYLSMARDAAAFLARPSARPPEASTVLPTWVTALQGARGLVVERGAHGVELYPVLSPAVLEAAHVVVPMSGLEEGLSGLAWPVPEPPDDDRAWLSAWLHAPRRSGLFVVIEELDPQGLAARIRDALAPEEE